MEISRISDTPSPSSYIKRFSRASYKLKTQSVTLRESRRDYVETIKIKVSSKSDDPNAKLSSTTVPFRGTGMVAASAGGSDSKGGGGGGG